MLQIMPCTFCAARKDPLLVYEERESLVLVDRAPICEGHLLVVSADHAASVADLAPRVRRSFLAGVERAIDLAEAVGSQPAFAVEHGRSPTCGDRSCSCHAHVHVVPLGEIDPKLLDEFDLLKPQPRTSAGSYLAVKGRGEKWRHFSLRRPIPHAARTLAGAVGTANGLSWRPLMMSADSGGALATLAKVHFRLQQLQGRRQMPSRHQCSPTISVARRRRKPVVVVSGSTGSGKTPTAAELARRLQVPAIELGVILRLAAGSLTASDGRQLPSALWRWSKNGRLDFEGLSSKGLAAAIPRLDGGAYELPMWKEIEATHLSSLARREDVQEVLAAIADRIARVSGAVIVGRIPPTLEASDPQVVSLDAAPAVRAARKRGQLAAIGMTAGEHDWFNPPSRMPPPESSPPGYFLDTTHLRIESMCAAALSALGGDALKLRAS